jgi:hypothetical protein
MPHTHKLIRIDGTETILREKPSIDEVKHLIGCDTLDYVTLNRRADTLMFVDDNGIAAGKRVNPDATRRYLRICKSGTTHQIHGDVVIINDTAGGVK